MKRIYLTEDKFKMLFEKKEEVTFYDFFINVKQFLKELLTNPNKAEPTDIFKAKGLDKTELVKKMENLGLIQKKERIDEVPVTEDKKHPYGTKLVAKHYIQYVIPKANFSQKIHKLYDELFSQQITEEGEGGATTCGSAMQGGGGNPDAGQYTVPFGKMQKRKIYNNFNHK